MIWRLMRWLPRTGQAGQVPYISLQGLETQLCQNTVIEILQMQSLGLDGQDLGVLAFSISSSFLGAREEAIIRWMKGCRKLPKYFGQI
jgi:hypothetical protein